MVSKIVYNPYDLVQIIINGKHHSVGRPVAFDSEVADQMTLLNAFGMIVRPTSISTTCPDCGAGMVIDVELAGDPPFDPYPITCSCKMKVIPIVDPFVNPVLTRRIKLESLNPLLADIHTPLPQSKLTVAERIRQNQQSMLLGDAPSKKSRVEAAEGLEGEEDLD